MSSSARETRASAIRQFARRLERLLSSPEAIKAAYPDKFVRFYSAQAAAGLPHEADPQRAATRIEGSCSSGPVHQLLAGIIARVRDEELTAAADVFLRAYLADKPRTRRPRVHHRQ
jgi:hypothetical protein